MDNRIQLLDCTLRDGGFEFEDAGKYGLSEAGFTHETMKNIASCLSKAGLDIIELGLIEQSSQDRRRFAIFQNIESVSCMIPSERSEHGIYTAMYRGPDTPADEIPRWTPACCEGVRVIIRYSELQKSIDFCSSIAGKGYKVFIQPSVTMRYSDKEIQMLIDAANDMQAYALYFVDTYGYMQPNDVVRFLKRYDAGLSPAIRVGYHAHNNMTQAVYNAIAFLAYPTERKIILDSCLLGFGQGAGNLQTEIITNYLNCNYGRAFDYGYIMDACEIVNQYLSAGISGYSVISFLSALHKTAYRYSMALRMQYGLSFREINAVLGKMPDDFRHRCTPEYTTELLRLCGYNVP